MVMIVGCLCQELELELEVKMELETATATPTGDGEMYAGKYVTNLSRPDNSNNNNRTTQTTSVAHFGLSQELYIAVATGSRDVETCTRFMATCYMNSARCE